jgi:polar amino acid transport system substrate-binding protein
MQRDDERPMTDDRRPTKDEGRRTKVSGQRSRSTRHTPRHTFWRIGSLPLALVMLCACAWLAFVLWFPKPPPKPDATWLRILETGVFRIGIDPSFPPFESDDAQGNLYGLDIALANELAREWSNAHETPIRIEYVYTGFDGLYDALKTQQFDAILSALPYDPKKTEDVLFSHSYFNAGPHIIVREDDTTTKTHYDLMGKSIGVELGSSGDAFARRWQRRLKFDLRTYHTPNDALRALQLGQVDAVFTDLIAFNDFARRAGGVKKVGDALINEFLVMAVRKDAPTLLGQINAVIDAMKRDGRMEQLYAEWLTAR